MINMIFNRGEITSPSSLENSVSAAGSEEFQMKVSKV